MKNSLLRNLILAVLLLTLGACNQSRLMQKFASQEDQLLAKSYIDLLRQQRFEDIEKASDPSILRPTLRDTLIKMSALIPAGEPTSVTLVGARKMNFADSSTVNLTFEYSFPGKWLVINVAVKRRGSDITIIGFNVSPQPSSIEEQNEFKLSGKAPLQYLILASAITLPLLTIWALILCVRTKFKGRKWPWVLFVTFGVGKLGVNWTTGQWAIAPLAVQIFSASAFAPLYGQWTIAISVPLGAVIFLLLRKRLSVPTGP